MDAFLIILSIIDLKYAFKNHKIYYTSFQFYEVFIILLCKLVKSSIQLIQS